MQHEHNSNPPANMSGGLPRIRRLIACHHEAGHAIAGLAHGLDVLVVALDEPATTGRYGHTDFTEWPRTRADAEGWGVMLVAGYLAAARYAAEIGVPAPDTYSSDNDRVMWEQHCDPWGLDLWDAIVAANHVLTARWNHVRKLAFELHQHRHVNVAQWIQGNPL